jgi:hypothetical protein
MGEIQVQGHFYRHGAIDRIGDPHPGAGQYGHGVRIQAVIFGKEKNGTAAEPGKAAQKTLGVQGKGNKKQRPNEKSRQKKSSLHIVNYSTGLKKTATFHNYRVSNFYLDTLWNYVIMTKS